VQRAAAERVLPNILMTLLEDDDAEVTVEAANALAAMADHSGAALDKLEAGHFAATPEKVSLNPVQEEVGEMDGVFGCVQWDGMGFLLLLYVDSIDVHA